MNAPSANKEAERPPGLSRVACYLGGIALAFALPLLYFRVTSVPAAPSPNASTTDQILALLRGISDAPAWYGKLRGGSVIAAFSTLILSVIALIMKHDGKLAGIAMVLSLGALFAAHPVIALSMVGVLVLLVILAVFLGLG